jgi:hypothetical protein
MISKPESVATVRKTLAFDVLNETYNVIIIYHGEERLAGF